MAKIISIVNQKGGVGKTTTSINLSAALGKLGKRVLLVDLDSQSNATTGLGLYANDFSNGVYELITGKCDAKKAIKKLKFQNLSLIPSSINLAGVEIEFLSNKDPEFRPNYQLKMKLDEIRDNYDYILIDCHPALDVVTMNALTACDSVIIPVQCEFYALDGIKQLLYTIIDVQKEFNHNLQIEGVLLTLFDGRTNIGVDVIEDVRNWFKEKVFNTIIPRLVRLAEAPSHGKPINEYDPTSRAAEAYMNLAKEVIERDGK